MIHDDILARWKALADENAEAIQSSSREQSAIYNRRQELALAVPALLAEVERLRANHEAASLGWARTAAEAERLRDACTECGCSLTDCFQVPKCGGIKCCPDCKHAGEASGWDALRAEAEAWQGRCAAAVHRGVHAEAERDALRRQVEAVRALREDWRGKTEYGMAGVLLGAALGDEGTPKTCTCYDPGAVAGYAYERDEACPLHGDGGTEMP